MYGSPGWQLPPSGAGRGQQGPVAGQQVVVQQRQVIRLQQQVAVLQVMEGDLVPVQDQQLAVGEHPQLGADLPGRDRRAAGPSSG